MFRTTDYDTDDIRYITRSRAVVTDNRDPIKAGRIRVEHPLLGETVWVPYLKLPGVFDVPKIGDIVYLECDAGHQEFPLAWGNLAKRDNAGDPVTPTEFQRDVPSNRGMYSPKGHFIELDDGEANDPTAKNDTDLSTTGRGLRFTSSGGHKVHLLDDTDAQETGILFEDSEGNKLLFDASNKKVTFNSTGDWDITVAGGKNETVNGDYKGSATGNFEYSAVTVKLGESPAFHATISENLIALYDEHLHPSPQAPAGLLTTQPPSVPMSVKAGTALDPTALFILIKGNG